MTIGEMIDWIVANRRGKVFRGYNVAEIGGALKQALEDKTLYYATNSDGTLKGLIVAIPFPKEKILFVAENMAMSLETLRQFARRARVEFPGWKLEAMRHNKHRHFNTEKLYNKLS